MTLVLAASSLITLVALAAVGFGPSLAARARGRLARRTHAGRVAAPPYDPGRERRAERTARELLRSVISDDEYAMYVELGFVDIEGTSAGYRYLLYPHRPIVAYDSRSGELLSEYCVAFPDRSEPALGQRLPAADDVLAKWMSLRGGERELIAEANMHVPGRQIDRSQVERDLTRLRGWRAARANGGLTPATSGEGG